MSGKQPAEELVSPIYPASDCIVVREVIEEGKSDGGILIAPGDKQHNPSRCAFGQVLAIGPGKTPNVTESGGGGLMLSDSHLGIYMIGDKPYYLAVGDIIVYPPFGGNELIVNGKAYRVIREQDIYGVVPDDDTK